MEREYNGVPESYAPENTETMTVNVHVSECVCLMLRLGEVSAS